MFADHFLPQLLFFLLSQAAAFGLLRTGMVVRGFLVMISGWILADLALVLHLVFPSQVSAYLWCLWGLQVLAITSGALFFGWRWLRMRKGFREAQEACYSEALDHFMAGRDEDARKLFGRLSKRDPWDVEALLFLGRMTAATAGGVRPAGDRRSRGRALRRMNRGLRLAGESPIAMEIEEEMRCLKRSPVVAMTPPETPANSKKSKTSKPKRPARKAAS